MKKIIPIILTVLLMCALCTTGLALDEAQEFEAEGDIGIRYTLIDKTSIGFSINSSGNASMLAMLWGTAGVDRVRVSCYLQKYDGGWSTVQHYSAESYSDYVAWSASRYVVSGYTYRLLVYYYAYDGNNYESTSRSILDTY